jgi:uncharacterized protein HemX
MRRLAQSGMAPMVIVLSALVVLAVGFVTLQVRDAQQNEKLSQTQSQTTQPAKTESKAPSNITSLAELDKATNALDTTAIDDINPDQLDSDLDSL